MITSFFFVLMKSIDVYQAFCTQLLSTANKNRFCVHVKSFIAVCARRHMTRRAGTPLLLEHPSCWNTPRADSCWRSPIYTKLSPNSAGWKKRFDTVNLTGVETSTTHAALIGRFGVVASSLGVVAKSMCMVGLVGLNWLYGETNAAEHFYLLVN